MSAFAPLAGVNRTSVKQAETDAAEPEPDIATVTFGTWA
jgi:DNA-binding XRE family transcriptional regulator